MVARRSSRASTIVAELREMRLPAWSRAVSAQGPVEAAAGAVNVPVVLGGQTVYPGDVVVADDDVVVVARAGVGPARRLRHPVHQL